MRVLDGQTDRQTDRHRPTASTVLYIRIVSRAKNQPYQVLSYAVQKRLMRVVKVRVSHDGLLGLLLLLSGSGL